MLWISIAVIAVGFIVGMPIWASLGLGSTLFLIFALNIDVITLPYQIFTTIDSWVLIAMPLFIFVGNIMSAGGTSGYLFKFMDSYVGHMRGGMPAAAVLTAVVFSALCGSSIATMSAVATLALPNMVSLGYDKKMTMGLLAVAGTLGNMIPPSLMFIMYGSLVQEDVSALFISGIIPGLILAVLLIATSIIISFKRNYVTKAAASWKTRRTAGIQAIPALIMPIIILGGIYSGIFTATEAAVVGGLYGILVGAFIYRKVTWSSLKTALVDTMRVSCTIYLLIGSACLFGMLLTYSGATTALVELIIRIQMSPLQFLIVANLLLLVLGMFLDAGPILYVSVPLLFPIAVHLGISPIHFGVLITLNLMIGQVTPPFGMCLFAMSGLAHEPFEDVARGVVPFVITAIFTLFLLTFVPSLSLFLPGLRH